MSGRRGGVAVVAATALVVSANTVIAVFSLVRSALVAERGMSDTAVALSMSTYLFALAFGGIVGGLIIHRVGPRLLMYVGAVLFGGGWFLAGGVDDPWTLQLTLGVLAGFGCGIIYNPAIATALTWFPDRPGVVTGTILAAGAIGPAGIAPALSHAISAWGVGDSLRVLGIVLFVCTAAGGWAIRYPEQATFAAHGRGILRRLAPVRTARFWLLFVVFAIVTTPGNMVVSALAPIVTTQIGGPDATASRALATALVTVLPLANFAGRLLFGVIFDRWGGEFALVLCLGLTSVALWGLLCARDAAVFIPALLLLGVAFGSTLIIFPPLTASEFGLADLALVYGIMFVGYAVGGLIGPLLTGVAVHRDAGRDAYATAYLVALVLCGAGVVLLTVRWLSRRPTRPSPDGPRSVLFDD